MFDDRDDKKRWKTMFSTILYAEKSSLTTTEVSLRPSTGPGDRGEHCSPLFERSTACAIGNVCRPSQELPTLAIKRLSHGRWSGSEKSFGYIPYRFSGCWLTITYLLLD